VFAGVTDSAVEVINLAEGEAAELGSGVIASGPIRLGLLCQENGSGARVLLSFGFSAEGVRRALNRPGGGSGRAPAPGLRA
jgi:hypothetical protein